MSDKFKLKRISIVIATLPNISIIRTLECINCSTFEDYEVEIIVVVPNDRLNFLEGIKSKYNLLIIGSIKYGQVYQRSLGFHAATGDYVLQLDDDIYVEFDTIINLTRDLNKLGSGNVVAPVMKDRVSGRVGDRLLNLSLKDILKNTIDYLVYGMPWGKAQQGVCTKYSHARGVDLSIVIENLVKVDWLPGGAVMCFKSDLVYDDFYPISGKALFEDLVHSKIRRERGIEHWVDASQIVMHDDMIVVYSNNNFCNAFKIFYSDLKKYYWSARILGGNLFRILIAIIYRLINFLFHQLLKFIKN